MTTSALKSRLAKVLLEHGIYADSSLLSELEQVVSGHKKDIQSEVSDLVSLFCELKHRPTPQPNTPKEYKEYNILYVAPMREIITCANGQSAEVVRRTVEKMRRDGLTCGYPKQLVTCALSMYDEMQSAGSGGGSAWEAWGKLRKYIDDLKEDGWTDSWIEQPALVDPGTQSAIDAIGWRSICEGSDYTRAHFVKAYEAHL